MKKVSFFIQRGGLGAIPLLLVWCFLLVLLAGGGLSLAVPQACAAGIQPGGVAAAWPCQGHDSRHTGQSPFLGAQTDALKWKWSAGGRIYSSPAIGADGTVYTGSDNGQICALRAHDGSLKWSYETGDSVYSSPALGQDGTLYVGSLDGRIYALTQDGSLKWSYQTADEIYSSPTVGPDGTIYVGSLDNSIYALTQDGSEKWSFRTGDDIYASPAVGPDGTIYVGSLDGQVYALNAGDGSQKWSYRIGYWIHSSPAVGPDGTVYVGSLDGRIYALRPQDGQPKWSFQTADDIYGSPALGIDGMVYIGSLDGRIYALNSIDGSKKWSYKTGAGIGSAPAIGSDGTVYIGSLDSRIYALKAQDGSQKWSCKTEGGIYSSPAIGADGTVCIGGLDGLVYAFGFPEEGVADSSWPCWRLNARHTGQSSAVGPQTSALKWKYQIGGEVYSSPVIGMDGTIYIGSYDSKIYALDPGGTGVKWSYHAGGRIRSTPAVTADGTIYAAGLDGVVYALKSWNGTLKWSYQIGNWIYSSPAVGLDGTVYLAGLDSKVYALKPDGSLKWSSKTGGGINSSPAIGADGLVYVGSGDGKVYAFSSQNGSQQWSYQTGERIYSSPALGTDGMVYVGSLDGWIYALNTYDGSLKWRYQTDRGIYSSPALGADGGLYVGSLNGRIYALNTADGTMRWSYQTGGGIYSSPALGADGTIYVGSLDSQIYAINSRDGTLKWSYQAGSRVDSSPAIASGGMLYAVDLNGMVYAFGDIPADRPPQLNCPDKVTALATGRTTRVSFTVAALDDKDPNPVITYDHKPGSEFPVGTTMVKVTARDASGNSSTCSFPVVVNDIEPPRVVCPVLPAFIEATGPKTRVDFRATATDNADPNPAIVYDYQPGSDFAPGATKVKVIATDASGNSSTCYFTVTIKDTTPPLITTCPGDQTVQAAGSGDTRVDFTAAAKDTVDPDPDILYDHSPGSVFPVGTTVVTVTARDDSGNSSTCTFKITVTPKPDNPARIICPYDMVVPATGPKTRVQYSATIVDNKDPRPLIIYDPEPGSEFPLGTSPVTVSAIDSSGKSSTCSFKVLVKDIEPPWLTCPKDMTVTAQGEKTSVYFTATASDNVDPNPNVVYDRAPGSEFALGTTDVKVTATDDSGNSRTCYFKVTVQDTTPPLINCSQDLVVPAEGSMTKVSYTITATDTVDKEPAIVCDPESGSEFPVGTREVKVTAKDYSGNTSTCTFKVTVTDEPLTLTCPSDMVVSATGPKTRVHYPATVTNNGTPPLPSIVYTPESGSEFSLGTFPVTVTATDSAGKSSTCSFAVQVKDTEPPRLTCPKDMTVTALGEKTRVYFTATASDNVDQDPNVVYDHAPGSEFAPGTTDVRVTATDDSGNSSDCSFKVTVQDITPPVLQCSQDLVVPAEGSMTRVSYVITAIDNVSKEPKIACNPESGSEFPIGTREVKVTAKDDAGNTSTCTFKVQVKDTRPPVISCPPKVDAAASGPLTRVYFSATATDNVDQNPEVVCDRESGSEFPPGITTVKVTATDAAGNASISYMTVNVKDSDSPLIICPEDMKVPATGWKTNVDFSVKATDAVDPRLTIVYDHVPGSEFFLGTTAVKVTATDTAGNCDECTFRVIVRDEDPPRALCPSDKTVSATGKGTRVDFTATAIDDVDPAPRIIYDHQPGSEFLVGTTKVKVKAADGSGNYGECTFQVTVRDTEPPRITCPADKIVAPSTTGSTTRVTYTATATDNVDTSPVISYDHKPGTEFPAGSTPVKVKAVDSAGNSSECTFTVTVKDTIPPVVTCPANMAVPATSGSGAKVYFQASATDNGDRSPVITYNPKPGTEFPPGTSTVRVTATDSSGNVGTCSFQVTVGDVVAPQVNCPADMTVAPSGQKTRVYFTATATDNADPHPSIVYDPEPGTEFSLGATTVRVKATDSSGNTGTCTFRVIVQDTGTPLAALTLGENAPYDTTQVMKIHYTVSDTCDPSPVVKLELSNNRDNPVDITAGSPILLPLEELAGQNTVTLTATDASGNVRKETVSFEVALKLSGDQITIKPEILRAFPGTFTVSLAFPPPYDTSTVYAAIADGAQHLSINYQPSEQKTVCEFQRSDIATRPLDTRFEVTGSFWYKGAECTFSGDDTIQFVVWPEFSQYLWPAASGRRSPSGDPLCIGPFCDRL